MTDEIHLRYHLPIIQDDALYSVLIPHQDVLELFISSDTLQPRFNQLESKVGLLLMNHAYTQWLESMAAERRRQIRQSDYQPLVTPASTGYLVQFYPAEDTNDDH